MPDHPDATWTRSRFCAGANSTCVEVSVTASHVQVRDSKAAGAGPVLTFDLEEWCAFVRGVRSGDFIL